MEQLRDQPVLVLGCGASGLAMARWCAQAGAQVTVADTRETPPQLEQLRQEIVLAIMGGIFVVEALSVMVQVVYFKYTKRKYGEGRRVLLMAPLHHHFEKTGWKETQVVIRFWIITMLLCLVGLSTLKLR